MVNASFLVAPAPSGPTSSASPDPQRLPAGICCLLAPPSSDKSDRAHVASIDGHESPVMFPSACQQLSFGLLASPAGLGFRGAAAVLLSLPLVQACVYICKMVVKKLYWTLYYTVALFVYLW